MTPLPIDVVTPVQASLGESPLWDPEAQKLYWVDINNKLLHVHDSSGENDTTFEQACEIGSIGRARAGQLIAGRRDGFGFIDPATGDFTSLIDPETGKPANRMNDGKMDRAGRYWCGSMQDPYPDEPAGALYKLSSDGACETMLERIRIPNALCWSPDNKTLYFADTRAATIWAFDFDLDAGAISDQRVFVDLSDQPGRPDGATVDADGCLWSAEYGGHRLVRYTPSGDVERVVDLPVANATCCAFGGPDFKTLYITTASQHLGPAELAKQPLAGALLACEPGVQGLPEPVFGVTLTS
jgi:sugar lactone lactonase YvrE